MKKVDLKMRPAGRHLLTIGRDLIQDKYAAVVEIVKNSFDADADTVHIRIYREDNKNIISIEDDGHGMSPSVISGAWLVPSTDDKLLRKRSPVKKRVMQGRKGVGRYAVSILGSATELLTIDKSGDRSRVYIDWGDFEAAKYLDDVFVSIETDRVSHKSGTKIISYADFDEGFDWSKGDVDKLLFELSKLVSPVKSNEEDFSVLLSVDDSIWGEGFEKKKVESVQLIDFFDYRIHGELNTDGKMNLIFETPLDEDFNNEIIDLPFGENECGQVEFDIRVFDRDKDAISSLISRGLKDASGNYLGKNQARQILNNYNGVGVYRNGFRIRPLGDPEYDWLELNKQRVQNPSMKIGSNQAIGYVFVQSEELSGLEEKSARDGLKENFSFECLKKASRKVIGELESRRFAIRRTQSVSARNFSKESKQKLSESEKILNKISKILENSKIEDSSKKKIVGLVDKEQKAFSRFVDEVTEVVARYQGQATLGKIVNVILHEGRKPMNYLNNQIVNLDIWLSEFEKNKDDESFGEIVSILGTFGSHLRMLSDLFKRIDPLAGGKRGGKTEFYLREVIGQCREIFSDSMERKGVSFFLECDEGLIFSGWRQDINIVFANLIENSIYWLNEEGVRDPRIKVNVDYDKDGKIIVDYSDNGPGIAAHLVKNQAIFDPEFSTKKNGTGLGLAVAGEAAARNGLLISAIHSGDGAFFRIEQEA